jgi:hypothetical protein
LRLAALSRRFKSGGSLGGLFVGAGALSKACSIAADALPMVTMAALFEAP